MIQSACKPGALRPQLENQDAAMPPSHVPFRERGYAAIPRSIVSDSYTSSCMSRVTGTCGRAGPGQGAGTDRGCFADEPWSAR